MSRCIIRWAKSCIIRVIPCIILCIDVSLAAFALAVPVLAADMAVKAPAPAVDRGELRAFVEGGAFWTAGGAIPYPVRGFEIFGAAPIFTGSCGNGSNASLRPRAGWDAAVGVDYRFSSTPWHVNLQARGGEARGSAAIGASCSEASFQLEDCCDPPIGIVTLDSRNARGIRITSTELKERHWQADFGMGYDFVPRLRQINPRSMQINFGVRVAEVRPRTTATTNASATATRVFQLNPADPLALVDTDTLVATASDVASVRRSFFGAGPRVGLEGSVPLTDLLAFDYSANAAVLFGRTKFTSESSSALSASSTLTTVAAGAVVSTETSVFSEAGPRDITHRSSSIAVYNFDIQAGFSWWLSPTSKLGLSYRLDAFIDPLRAAPDGGRVSRFYHGPKLTLTGTF
jgi:hypothetical protein